MAKYPSHLSHLIAFLKKFPGVGARTAERFAFHMLEWPEDHLKHLADLAATLKEKVKHCDICGCLKEKEQCAFCEGARDRAALCVISSPKDAYAIEETRFFHGLYHVLGGLLSPLDGRTPDHLSLQRLKDRIASNQVTEVIVALESTIEGDATALYLKEQLSKLGVKISRLALGLPMGSPLEYIDGGTLSRALSGRQLL